ncbi:hypothetical protein H310_10254 [Aphanomyces invadans]|uniref:Uncharacterized protein n=1 Tax=Aphanomyces invadans TaxID=157072 RepID=A0A024TRA0_9STRA|nr:hypothetical protein H310_10254 [Aphanomyces invadans]ETV96543.1 hypothetical protein H310_10254 [Aphanomyces invadans]|eukprot:XP_008874806.1 hypothetical protein H310_10254 [Aphanomyces invadans]
MYWAVVYPSRVDKVIRLKRVFQHGINCIVLIGEFVLNGFVVRKASLGLIVILPVLYATFAWISHETWNYGLWPYKFLDISSHASPVCLSNLKSRSRPALDPVANDPDLVANENAA